MEIYPTVDSVRAFLSILKRGDLETYIKDISVLEESQLLPIKIYYEYLLAQFKKGLKTNRELLAFHMGFLMCLHFFKRHLETLEFEYEPELNNLQNYIEFLENELNGLKG